MRRYYPLLFFLSFALLLLLVGRVRIAPPDLAFYYSYGHSLLYDLDFCFANQYNHFTFGLHETYLTPQGYPANDWPMGTGLAWLPFFLLATLAQGLASLFGFSPTPDGFGWFHEWTITYGSTLVYGAGTLYLAYRIARLEGLNHASSLASCLLLALGSTLTYHLYVNSADSHPPSAFFIALFIYQWLNNRDHLNLSSGLQLGLWIGLAALIRPHNAIFILTPILDHLISKKPFSSTSRLFFSSMMLASLLTFLPQMMVWNVLHGSWLELPRSQDVLWLQPHLWETLFSDFHGMISWSPLFGLGLLGLFCRKRWVIYWLPLLIQLYVYSCNIAWWSGGSFGNRRMVGCAPFFILGLAFLWQHLPRLWLKILAILCALWTFLLLNAEVGNTIALDHYMSWGQILQAIPQGFLPGLARQIPFHEWSEFFFPRIAGAGIVLLFLTLFYVLYQKSLPRLKPYATPLLLITLVSLNLFGLLAMQRTTQCREKYELSDYIPYDRFSWTIYYEKGFYQAQTGKPFDSMQSFLAAALLEPRHPQPWMYLGILCFNNQWFPLDYHYLSETMKRSHRNPYFLQHFIASISHKMDTGFKPLHRLYNQRGILYASLGDFTQAERDFNFALQQEPDYESARENKKILQQWIQGSEKPFYWK